jgi:hypothetical protein
MKSIKILLLGLAIGAPTAQANLVTNGGFEQPGTLATTPGYQYLPNNNTSVTGWTSISDNVGEESYLMNKNRSNNSYLNRVYEGSYGLALNTGNAVQTSVTLTAGTIYDLSFMAKANVTGASPLQVNIGGFTSSLANTTTFTPFLFQFTAASTDPEAILKFLNPSVNGGNRMWNLDAVNLQPVPVPAAVWTFLTGLMGLLTLGRRKQSIA